MKKGGRFLARTSISIDMPITDNSVSKKQVSRLVSLDVLRGFDMFWLIGAKDIANGLRSLNLPGVSALAGQLSHTKWNGLTFYDLIFPLFIFITGVSLSLSLKKRIERGGNRGVIVKHVLKRSVILFLLGIVYNGIIISWPFLDIRVMGVLQRISLCYFFTSLLVLYTKPRTQYAIVLGILLGYWAIMRFVPVPGYGVHIWTEIGNFAGYIDRLLLPGRLYHGNWDPEGILSTIPAISTCLIGVLSGNWLQHTEQYHGETLHANQPVINLFFAGLILIILSLLINPVFPINKNLWTSSFVLLTGGLSVILLAILYWIIDIRGYRRWAFPFVVIGMNSIFIYMAARFIPFNKAAFLIVGGDHFAIFGRSKTLVITLVELLLEGLLLLWLYKRKIFIKI